MCYCAKFTNYSTVSSAPIIKVLQGFFSCLHAGKKQKKKMKEACFFFFLCICCYHLILVCVLGGGKRWSGLQLLGSGDKDITFVLLHERTRVLCCVVKCGLCPVHITTSTNSMLTQNQPRTQIDVKSECMLIPAEHTGPELKFSAKIR